jgi:flavin reductase (DIM6/NTAB) family NADH-FMN oxidoreductase RutF
MARESTPLLPEKTGLQANLQAGKSTARQKWTDTTANLKNGQGFAVNIISEAFVENANLTAVDAPPEFDEWALSGLTKEKCVRVDLHRSI